MEAGNETVGLSYGGATVQARGWVTIMAIILIAITGFGYWTSHEARAESRDNHAAVMAELRVITYILSQPPEKRPDLAMPPELQKRLKRMLWPGE